MKIKIGFGILLLSLILLFALNLIFGSVKIPFSDIKQLFFAPSEANIISAHIVFKTRLPQAITAALAGAALSAAGLLMQTLFRNPLADPSILGISSGASLGVAFLTLTSGWLGFGAMVSMGIFGQLATIAMAFGGAMITLTVIINLSRKISSNAVLLIIGIMIAYSTGAIIDVLRFFSPSEDVQAYAIWGMGSFSNVTNNQLIIISPIIAIALFACIIITKPLNIITLGNNYSTNLGINIKHIRFIIIMISGLLTATITAICGPIAFIGLAVPHLTKALMRTSNHGALLPAVMLAGATLALLCNLIARLPGFHGTLPINSVTAFVGAPVVIWVLIAHRKDANL